MHTAFYDRLTQTKANTGERQHTILGQWLLPTDLPDGNFLNSVPVSAGDFLVPEVSGGWSFLSLDGFRIEGSYTKSQLPDELEGESIRTLGVHLAHLEEEGAGWCEWLDVVPLVPGMSNDVEFLSLDQKIKDSFGHLETVCKNPRAHLHVEVERVNIAKARRIPASAPAYLASHTEDWDRPLLKGVLPKRVLAEVCHDQVDIYENRVAARLVDNLLFYLLRRIQVVRKLLKVFEDKENYSSKAGGTYLRQKRILGLWGNSIDSNEGRKKAERTLKELEWLKYKLMGLMDSPLYSEVPRRSYVATTLRMTNILANDQHYRHVAELWNEWGKSSFARSKSPKEIYSYYQELCSGFDSFTALLIVRALDEMGYVVDESALDEGLTPGCVLPVNGNGATFNFSWGTDGSVSIKSANSSLRFISFANNFAASSNDEQTKLIFEKCQSVSVNENDRIVMLYAASDESKVSSLSSDVHRSLHTVGNDPKANLPPGIGLLPVSPWEIGSVERVTRALRWHLDSERFLEYPISLRIGNPTSVDLLAGERDGWLEVKADKTEILRPPFDFEWQQLNLHGQLKDAKDKLAEAESEHEKLSAELKDAVRDRDRKVGLLNPQKKAAHQLKTDLGKKVEGVGQLLKAFEAATKRMESLIKCPSCGTVVNAKHKFKIGGQGSFQCECPDCKTSWGTKICEGGHKFSTMLPGEWLEVENLSPGWEDVVYGSDLLAVPGKTDRGEWGFVCPDCGTVTT